MNQMVYEWRWPIAAPAADVWRLLRDTERLNKAAGLQVVQFVDERAADGGLCRTGSFDFLGMRIVWDERPYEWLASRWMAVERVYRQGPMRRMLVRFDLEPAGTGCTVTVSIRIDPAGWWARPVVHSQIVGAVRPGFDRMLRHLDAHLAGRVQRPWPDEAVVLQPEGRARAAATRVALRDAGIDAGLADRIVQRVLTAADRDVVRMRPHAEALELNAPRALMLRAMLIAAEAGLVELMWDVNCPHCRGGPRARHLAELRATNACLACNIEFQAQFDADVEVTFAAHPNVRRLDLSEHCVGGPGKTPHVFLQRRIPAGETVDVTVDLPPGRYRVRTPLSRGVAELILIGRQVAAADGQVSRAEMHSQAELPIQAELRIQAGGLHLSGPMAACSVLRVVNATDVEQLLSIDDPRHSVLAATGAQVSALQAFRSRFVHEVMPVEQPLAVGRMTFLFTDLRSSTAMYERIGDGEALARVRQHFTVLFGAVEQHNGAVVKTVGDAVMAVFDNPADALRAATDAVTQVGQLHSASGDPLVLRIGVHAGACLAVNLDQRLDYFGSTVNRAARIEHESLGNDIVFSEGLLDEPEVRDLLVGRYTQRFDTTLRGVPQPVRLVRLYVDGRTSPALRRPTSGAIATEGPGAMA